MKARNEGEAERFSEAQGEVLGDVVETIDEYIGKVRSGEIRDGFNALLLLRAEVEAME